ncbi:hypothetical protein TSAR_007306 [Trichomalopsis sarcophagae]|uniref:Uncharacterized protein n=1 Tax=Trichomalopsis sarcophagae TaxID=543379 RepID=A0A232FJ09_9HYME|nr:hypothetical protein TSAR_007306 [Trichomalopsis sarcophagae]
MDNLTDQGEKAEKGAFVIWNKIRHAKQERESIWGKIRDRLDFMDNVVKRLERGQVALKKSKKSFGLMLSKAEMLLNQ